VRPAGNEFIVVAVLAGFTFAQTPNGPSFEVASIKLHVPTGQDRIGGTNFPGGRVTASFVTLRDLIISAYDLRPDQISGGPGWIYSDRYDLVAKAAGNGTPTEEELHQMMRSLLADRFRLQIHRQMKEMPVYALLVGKNGPKLKQSASDEKSSAIISQGQIIFSKIALPALAYNLSQFLDRPVLDRTGLSENYYDFKLEWTPDSNPTATDPNSISVRSSYSGPSIFTAVQEQLGLKLESVRAPQEILVIDRAERPSEN
jgi:uncharacterized protein (TIGR03435 family)